MKILHNLAGSTTAFWDQPAKTTNGETVIFDANEQYARDLRDLVRSDDFQQPLMLLLGYLDLYSIETWRENKVAAGWLAQNGAANPDAALTLNVLRLFDQLRVHVVGNHWAPDEKGRRTPVWRLQFRPAVLE